MKVRIKKVSLGTKREKLAPPAYYKLVVGFVILLPVFAFDEWLCSPYKCAA